jgi:mRNA interferase RelE/StbE
MKYKVEFTSGFSKEFKKLDRYTMLFIKAWIQNHLADCENPRQYGKEKQSLE